MTSCVVITTGEAGGSAAVELRTREAMLATPEVTIRASGFEPCGMKTVGRAGAGADTGLAVELVALIGLVGAASRLIGRYKNTPRVLSWPNLGETAARADTSVISDSAPAANAPGVTA
jgi:hypothetical protein